MRVAALRIGGEPDAWRDLGFDVDDRGIVVLGGVRLELGSDFEPGAIASWALDGNEVPPSIDGLRTGPAKRSEPGSEHPNGALAIDHVVVFTPSLERTASAFAEIGVECRRIREAGGGARQGFFIVGDLLVEVVDGTGLGPDAPARFWGITVEVADINRTSGLLGERLERVKDAVQPGRRIATVRPEASGGLPLAFITQRKRPAE